MSSHNYENAYRDARDALYRRGKKVGRPFQDAGGPRSCRVNGVALSDCELFAEAWGHALADEIIRDQAGRAALPYGCAECDRLWLEYTNATARYLKLFTEQQIALFHQDPATLARLAPVLSEASQIRQRARQSVREHGTAHISRVA